MKSFLFSKISIVIDFFDKNIDRTKENTKLDKRRASLQVDETCAWEDFGRSTETTVTAKFDARVLRVPLAAAKSLAARRPEEESRRDRARSRARDSNSALRFTRRSGKVAETRDASREVMH